MTSSSSPERCARRPIGAHAGQRLVEQHHLRIGRQHHRDFELALFAVAEHTGHPVDLAGQASFFNNASAGEYAAFTVIAGDAPYLELALITLVANARYMLMSCVVSQKFSSDTPLLHRLLVGFDVTDEIFGITIARKGPLNPFYNYGAMSVALPGWSIRLRVSTMSSLMESTPLAPIVLPVIVR